MGTSDGKKNVRMSGTALLAAARLAESPGIGALIYRMATRDLGLADLAARPVPGGAVPYLPLHLAGDPPAQAPAPPPAPELRGPGREGYPLATVADYVAAYRSGRCTPVGVVKALFQQVRAWDDGAPPMRLFIAQDEDDALAQARAAAERHAGGAPLGPLDGVPVAVKDEVDQRGYPTTGGTSFLGTRPAEADATPVARLRAAGAILVGKTNMHEVGLGVTGINPHHGTPRNPHDPARMTGGSSSGSGAVAGSGLCPIAVGADGGGSIRIPAALCGATGIKATFGRVSEHGALPICWSVAHVGPLAATCEDLAVALAVMGGPDPADPNTLHQPPLSLGDLHDGVRGLRVGWCPEWAAGASDEVRAACEEARDLLGRLGAEVREVRIDHLDLVRPVQYATIGVEMAASQYEQVAGHRLDYGADVRLLLRIASQVPAVQFVRAQRMRALVADAFQRALQEVDILLSPATGTTAPPIPRGAERYGLRDDALLEAITAFAFPANLTGLPALTLPVGRDAAGMPVGLQMMAGHWREALLLRAGVALERVVERPAPRVRHRPLAG